MVKHWEQMIMERQVTECVSTEELFVLWQVMQQMEAPENGEICYPEIDRRTFHIDGKLSEQGYDGTVYLLREPDMRAYIQQGSGMPAIVDARRMIREKGIRFEPALRHVIGMQRILNGAAGEKMSDEELLAQCALVYVNKRGGKESGDGLCCRYGLFYIEFLRRQLKLLAPKRIVCCGEDIFRLAVKEVVASKKQIKNKGEHTVWKDVVKGFTCYADENLRPAGSEGSRSCTLLHMWNPSYRVNKETYVSLDEYLKEFKRRIADGEGCADEEGRADEESKQAEQTKK